MLIKSIRIALLLSSFIAFFLTGYGISAYADIHGYGKAILLFCGIVAAIFIAIKMIKKTHIIIKL